MAANFTPLNLDRFGQKKDSKLVDTILVIVAIVTGIVLVALILIFVRENLTKKNQLPSTNQTPTLNLPRSAPSVPSPTGVVSPTLAPDATESGQLQDPTPTVEPTTIQQDE